MHLALDCEGPVQHGIASFAWSPTCSWLVSQVMSWPHFPKKGQNMRVTTWPSRTGFHPRGHHHRRPPRCLGAMHTGVAGFLSSLVWVSGPGHPLQNPCRQVSRPGLGSKVFETNPTESPTRENGMAHGCLDWSSSGRPGPAGCSDLVMRIQPFSTVPRAQS